MLPFIKFNNKDGQNNGVHSIKFRYPKIENIQYNVNYLKTRIDNYVYVFYHCRLNDIFSGVISFTLL